MNICIISDDYPYQDRMVFVFVQQLVEAMVDEGVKVDVIAAQSLTRSLIRGVKLMPKKQRYTTNKGNEYLVFRPFAIEHPNSNIITPKPKSFDKMLEYARILSAGKALSRIDFYEIAGKPYFGEITFYPYSGLERFDKDEWNVRLGDWIKLPIE